MEQQENNKEHLSAEERAKNDALFDEKEQGKIVKEALENKEKDAIAWNKYKTLAILIIIIALTLLAYGVGFKLGYIEGTNTCQICSTLNFFK